jgi:hypothetical protein
MQWSFGLLDTSERQAFTALAAFRGGCTLEAAEAVTKAPLATLESLMAKSLLKRQAGRLAMLETVRQYARTPRTPSPTRRSCARARRATI